MVAGLLGIYLSASLPLYLALPLVLLLTVALGFLIERSAGFLDSLQLPGAGVGGVLDISGVPDGVANAVEGDVICFLDDFQAQVLANFAMDKFQAQTAYCLGESGSEYDQGLSWMSVPLAASRTMLSSRVSEPRMGAVMPRD